MIKVVGPLPPRTLGVFVAIALSAIGSGLTGPFLVIYLHSVQHYSMAVAGAALAAGPFVSLAGNPLGGYLIDRRGLVWPLVGGLGISSCGCLGLVSITHAWQPIVACAVIGFGASIAWPAESALLARLATDASRATVYSLRNVILNLGLATGGLIGSLAAVTGRFAVLFLVDGVTFVAAAVVLARATRALSGVTSAARPETALSAGGYRLVFKDAAFVRLFLLTFVMTAAAYGQFRAVLPAYASENGLSPTYVSIAYVVNTVVVVVAQMPVTRLLSRRSRPTALNVLCVTYVATWAVVWLSGTGHGSVQATLFVGGAALFACGELFISPTIPPLVNELAPQGLEGRYNGAMTLAFTSGLTLAPLMTGITLAIGAPNALFAMLISGCLLSMMLVRSLRPHLNSDSDAAVALADVAGDHA